MPLYMDVHRNMQGVNHEDVARAHELDQAVQAKHNVRYLQYWFNDALGAVYCLVDAPSKEAAIDVHREAHDLLPAEIIEVQMGTTADFLGTSEASLRQDERLVAEQGPEYDTAFRAILFSDMEGSTALTPLSELVHEEVVKVDAACYNCLARLTEEV